MSYHVFFLILVDTLAALLLLRLVPQRLRDLLDREVGVAALHKLLQSVVDELVLVLQDGIVGKERWASWLAVMRGREIEFKLVCAVCVKLVHF